MNMKIDVNSKTYIKTPDLSHLSSKDFEFVYEPAEDSFLLMDALETQVDYLLSKKPFIVLEVGSGSGCISSFLASILSSSAFYICTDINMSACKATRASGLLNGLSLNPINTDLISGLKLEGQVDLLIFNPPYVPTEDWEGILEDPLSLSWAGGKDGRRVVDKLLSLLPSLLSLNSTFYLLLVRENKPEEIKKLMRERGFQSEIILQRQAKNEKLLVLKFTRF